MATVRLQKDKSYMQLRWEISLRDEFYRLIEDYDPTMSAHDALIKLVQRAIKDWYIPGYERKEKTVPTPMSKVGLPTFGKDVRK